MRNERLQTDYEALLFSYAAGCVNEAQSLIVAAHLTLSPRARELVCEYEALGGALVEKGCGHTDVSKDCLESIFARLDCDEECRGDDCPDINVFPRSMNVPRALIRHMQEMRQTARWKTLYPGLQTFEVALNCPQSRARFIKASPQCRTLRHGHRGVEITLVLDGAFTDETGTYQRGDLVVTDADLEHSPVAEAGSGCMCFIVSTAPVRLTGWARVFNPFIRL